MPGRRHSNRDEAIASEKNEKLWREIFYHSNLFEQAPRVEVPVYFLVGRYDWIVTADVAQRYFDALDAPRGKQLIWFENSGHWPHLEEPERFREQMIRAANEAARAFCEFPGYCAPESEATQEAQLRSCAIQSAE